jgi:protease II
MPNNRKINLPMLSTDKSRDPAIRPSTMVQLLSDEEILNFKVFQHYLSLLIMVNGVQ